MRLGLATLASLLVSPLVVLAAPLHAYAESRAEGQLDRRQADLDKSVQQAIAIATGFNADFDSVISAVRQSAFLTLSPGGYDIPEAFDRAVTSAIGGITSIPDIAQGDVPTPEEVAQSYGGLVDIVGKSFFYSLIELKKLTQRAFQNQEYSAFADQVDQGIYEYVLAMNAKFGGFTCQLAKQFGTDSPVGQTLQVLSEQLFARVFDNIAQGQC